MLTYFTFSSDTEARGTKIPRGGRGHLRTSSLTHTPAWLMLHDECKIYRLSLFKVCRILGRTFQYFYLLNPIVNIKTLIKLLYFHRDCYDARWSSLTARRTSFRHNLLCENRRGRVKPSPRYINSLSTVPRGAFFTTPLVKLQARSSWIDCR